MTALNPSTDEFAALLEEDGAAWQALADKGGTTGPEYDAAEQRARRASEALHAARPVELAAMAMQLRWLAGTKGAIGEEQDAILEHIARQLEALAGGIVVSAEAAAQVRGALLWQLEEQGGSLEEHHERGLGDYDRRLEATLRAAYRLLLGAPPAA